MITTDDFDELATGARAAVFEAHLVATKIIAGWDKLATPPTHRPVEVANLLAMLAPGVRDLVTRWRPTFERRKAELRVSGVFCHKTPLADDEQGRSCELGDLLIVHDDYVTGGRRRRAILLQTKMWGSGQTNTVDHLQLQLYRGWPKFKLRGRSAGSAQFAPGWRSFPQDHSNTFARYALVSEHPHSVGPFGHNRSPNLFGPYLFDPGLPYPWTTVDPRGPISTVGGEDFGHLLASMLFQTVPLRGQSVEASPSTQLQLGQGKDIDKTVQELLDVTGTKLIKARGSSHTLHSWDGIGRLQQMNIQYLQGGTGSSSFPPTGLGALLVSEPGDRSERPTVGTDPDDGEGISVLLVETSGIQREDLPR